MANPTNPFNWQMPTSTDLVTDLPADFETFGQAVATSMADLLGGTTGQVLSKASNTDMDFTWVTSDDANAIQNTIVDAKGDLIGATAADTPARLAVGTNGQVLTADSTAATGLAWATPSAGSSYVAGKNLIINGGFDIWQRGTSAIAIGSGGDYTADRWQGYRSGAGFTVSRQTTSDTTNLPFIQYCARIQRASGNSTTASAIFASSTESVNAIPYAGKAIVFSFYARAGANFSATSSQLTVQLQTGTGTDQNAIMTGYTGLVNAVNSTATLTTTWQRFTYTATLGATITEIAPYFTFAPTGTAGANDYYEITGVQVEIAATASAFSRNAGTIQGELAACQRYYESWTATSANYGLPGAAAWNATTGGKLSVQFVVPKRVAPSVAFSNIVIISGTSSPAVTSLSFFGGGSTSGVVGGYANFGVASGGTVGHAGVVMDSGSANGFINWSAEL